MNRCAAVALIALIALAGCSGSGTTPSPVSPAQADSNSAFQFSAYQVPVVSDDPALQSAQTSSAGSRNVEESYGGIPGQALIIDGTNFPAGSQANFAISSVSAVANGVTYPIVQFLVPVVINVLNFQNNALLLGAGIVPKIQYSGVQYVIDPKMSSVVINGKTYPMSFGTTSSSTFTPIANGMAALYFPDPVNAATTQPNFLVDFNAATWITISNGVADVVPQGSGTVLSEAAVIQGTILNKAGGPVSGAIVSAYGPNGIIVNSAPSSSTGAFAIHAISGNGYSLVVWNTYAPVSSIITNQATGNDPVGWTVQGPTVTVPAGYTVNVGTIRD
jgi:hypothetical protein